MIERHPVLAVARWELRRFFKLKEHLVGMALLLAGALLSVGVVRWMEARAESERRLFLAAPPAFDASPLERRAFALERIDPADPLELAAARAAVLDAESDGLLVVPPDFGAPGASFQLALRRKAGWNERLAAGLAETLGAERATARGLSPADLSELLQPPALALELLDPRAERVSDADQVAAFVAILFVIFGTFTGAAYLLVGITGEKQLRITEQVLAAIRPQQWIDGKVLGLAALTMLSLASYAGAALIGLVVARAAGLSLPLPALVLDPLLLLRVILIALLGFAFWFTSLAGLCATIDDPNHSARAGWTMLSSAPLVVAFAVLQQPEGLAPLLLGLFPPTAAAVLPARLVLGAAAWWEVPVAALLLGIAIALARRAAGRIFALGIEMRGKEPTWGELLRAARRAR